MSVSEKIAQGASNLSYAASGGTFVAGGLSTNEMIAAAGLALAFATFLVNWYYRHKHYRLAVSSTKSAEHRIDEL